MVPDIATFTVLFLNFAHGLVFRAEYISEVRETSGFPSLCGKVGNAPTQLSVIESLDYSNLYKGIFTEASRLRVYEQNVIRILHDLCLYSIISLPD